MTKEQSLALAFILLAWAAILAVLPGCYNFSPGFYCAGSEPSLDEVAQTESYITFGEPSTDRRATVALVWGANRIGCTGTAFNARTIITAAHCIKNPPSGVVLKDGGYRYDTESVLVHPGYNLESETWPGPAYDLGLVFLAEDVPPPYVNTIYDPVAGGFAPDWRESCTGLVAQGFGQNENGIAGKLRESPYLVVGMDSLSLKGRGVDGQSVCIGDSGGPLYAYTEAGHPDLPTDMLMLAGVHVASIHGGDLVCQGPTTHVNLINFKPWILDSTQRGKGKP